MSEVILEPWRFFGLPGFDIEREVVDSFFLFGLEACLVAAAEGVVLSGDGTLGSAAGTDIGSGSKPGGNVGVLATVVGLGILAGPGSVIS